MYHYPHQNGLLTADFIRQCVRTFVNKLATRVVGPVGCSGLTKIHLLYTALIFAGRRRVNGEHTERETSRACKCRSARRRNVAIHTLKRTGTWSISSRDTRRVPFRCPRARRAPRGWATAQLLERSNASRFHGTKYCMQALYATAVLSVRPSVCLSVTLVICFQTAEHILLVL